MRQGQNALVTTLFICYYLPMDNLFEVKENEGRNLLNHMKWIGCPETDGPVFKGDICYSASEGAVQLYFTALGFTDVHINGVRVGDEMFVPAWSDYHSRGFYPGSYSYYFLCRDITPYLTETHNTIEIRLGNGWYNQNVRTCEGNMVYGVPKIKAVAVQKEKVLFRSDRDTRAYKGPIVYNQMYIGEIYNANVLREPDVILNIETYDNYDSVPRLQNIPCDKVIKVHCLFPVSPKLIYEDKARNLKTYDAGVNMTGRIFIVTSTVKGNQVHIRYAESVDADGQLTYSTTAGVDRLQEDVYISDGTSGQKYGAEFVLHGFRYFTIEGEIDTFRCDLILPDLKERKHFITKNKLLEEIVRLYQRAQLTNMHWGVPSDCPHRERLGYTGDGQLTADVAMYFWQTEAFYLKWMRDLADSQDTESGHIPHTAPFAGGGGGPGLWGGAMVFLPWKLYREYGNHNVLFAYYDYMVKWMDYLDAHSASGLLDHEEPVGWCLGDWCAPGGTKLDAAFVNSCCYIYQLNIMERIAQETEHKQDLQKYKKRRLAISEKLIATYKVKGRFFEGREGADAFAYAAGLLTDEEAKSLLLEYNSKPLDTGIGGTPALFWALRRLQMDDTVRSLLASEEYPSFGYMVKSGATTMWETFEGKDSLNHPMFGAFIYYLLPEF